MLANSYWPSFSLAEGLLVFLWVLGPSLAIETAALRLAATRYPPTDPFAPKGLPKPFAMSIGLRDAIGIAVAANAVSTLVGLAALFSGLPDDELALIAIHYVMTIAIEVGVLAWARIRLSKLLIATFLVANAVTYGMVFALELWL